MTRLLAVVLVALAAAGSASADSFQVVDPLQPVAAVQPAALLQPVTLPSAAAPNEQNVLLPELLGAPAQPQQLTYEQLLAIWQGAAQAYGVPWSVLAAINKIESNFGQNMGPSSAGAIGWMQFMPDTWARWGLDADGDGIADPWNPQDAIYSSARYLAATGGGADIAGAVFSYNHAQWYVDEVLQLAQQYDGGGASFSNSFNAAQQTLDSAKQAVADANGKVLNAEAAVTWLQLLSDRLFARADRKVSFSNRLAAQKTAVLMSVRVEVQQAVLDTRRADLLAAESALATARDQLSGASFAPGTSTLLGAPSYSNGYVFPVAGGAGVVSVGHTHHDYPAADITAPEGTQLYALSDGTVEKSWASPEGNCGIGFTIRTTDGLTWTYCHLSYLEPAVMAGAQLTAGQPVGLVGQTGDATGPHLHLQLAPATGYPQDEAWFQSFAGTAFTWSDSVQANPAQGTVFAVLDDGDGSEGARSLASAGAAGATGATVFFTASGG
jgi:murein DD-endopeptidase MepM/ murein hydrolase activator NlpD